MKKHSRLVKTLRLSLLIGWSMSMAACSTCPKMPKEPAKPTIKSMRVLPNGGLAIIEPEDVATFANYLADLHRGYK